MGGRAIDNDVLIKKEVIMRYNRCLYDYFR